MFTQQNNILDINTAASIALQTVPGSIVELELDNFHGRPVYEVEILSVYGKYEIIIDAFTGAVLRIELD